jgi:predicted DNA-binding ribbon-helix-helix protein
MPDNPDGVIKRSLLVAGHRTSVSVEEPFWAELKRVAAARGMSVAALVAEIDRGRKRQNLSSAIRVFVLKEASGG